MYPAERSPTAQFGQDRDFAVTLRAIPTPIDMPHSKPYGYIVNKR